MDFFRAKGRREVERLLQALEGRIATGRASRSSRNPHLPELSNRTWVTRKGVHATGGNDAVNDQNAAFPYGGYDAYKYNPSWTSNTQVEGIPKEDPSRAAIGTIS